MDIIARTSPGTDTLILITTVGYRYYSTNVPIKKERLFHVKQKQDAFCNLF